MPERILPSPLTKGISSKSEIARAWGDSDLCNHEPQRLFKKGYPRGNSWPEDHEITDFKTLLDFSNNLLS